jgi:hypothetical protein
LISLLLLFGEKSSILLVSTATLMYPISKTDHQKGPDQGCFGPVGSEKTLVFQPPSLYQVFKNGCFPIFSKAGMKGHPQINDLMQVN